MTQKKNPENSMEVNEDIGAFEEFAISEEEAGESWDFDNEVSEDDDTSPSHKIREAD